MGIFSDAQGQLTPQSVVGSGRNSNSLELSCMPSLPASMKRIGEKNSREHGNTVFSIITLSVAMETSCWIWPNFKLIQALKYVIVTCKYEMDPIKNSREKVATPFFPLLVYEDFFKRSRAVAIIDYQLLSETHRICSSGHCMPMYHIL